MTRAKGCPRCWYDKPRLHTEIGGTGEKQLQCPACHYQSGFFPLETQAVFHWNKVRKPKK